MPTSTGPAFRDRLLAALPGLGVHALTLTRNRAAADDLVHDAVCNALAAEPSFVPGSNFAAWMHRILRNRFITLLRKAHPSANIDDVPPEFLAVQPAHDDRLAVQDLDRAMRRLTTGHREALMLVAIHGTSYRDLAAATGWKLGTAKSRVFRARRQLAATLGIDTTVDGSANQ